MDLGQYQRIYQFTLTLTTITSLCIHTHWQIARSQNLPKSMAAPMHGRRKSTVIQHCIRAKAGEVVNQKSLNLT
jgi:hypothetical protein